MCLFYHLLEYFDELVFSNMLKCLLLMSNNCLRHKDPVASMCSTSWNYDGRREHYTFMYKISVRKLELVAREFVALRQGLLS